MRNKLKCALELTVIGIVVLLIFSVLGFAVAWFFDKDHIQSKVAAGGFYMLVLDGDTYPTADRVVLVNERFFNHHKVGDSIHVSQQESVGDGKVRIQCADFHCGMWQ
jgi:hypothetical protein